MELLNVSGLLICKSFILRMFMCYTHVSMTEIIPKEIKNKIQQNQSLIHASFLCQEISLMSTFFRGYCSQRSSFNYNMLLRVRRKAGHRLKQTPLKEELKQFSKHKFNFLGMQAESFCLLLVLGVLTPSLLKEGGRWGSDFAFLLVWGILAKITLSEGGSGFWGKDLLGGNIPFTGSIVIIKSLLYDAGRKSPLTNFEFIFGK